MPTAVEFFLKLDKIDGESMDSKHKGEINVESFSWGVNHANVNGGFGSGAGAGRASFEDFSFVSRSSKASPQLMLACATGRHIATGVLTGRLTGNAAEFYTVKLTDILVSSFKDVSDSQTGNHDGFPMSHVSLSFGKILFIEQSILGDGSVSPPASFDIQRNVEG